MHTPCLANCVLWGNENHWSVHCWVTSFLQHRLTTQLKGHTQLTSPNFLVLLWPLLTGSTMFWYRAHYFRWGCQVLCNAKAVSSTRWVVTLARSCLFIDICNLLVGLHLLVLPVACLHRDNTYLLHWTVTKLMGKDAMTNSFCFPTMSALHITLTR